MSGFNLRQWAAEVGEVAEEAKALAGHAEHDGYSFAGEPRVLRCGCGADLVGVIASLDDDTPNGTTLHQTAT